MSRIVAGKAKGHRLFMPDGASTRPTSDRVREAAFSLIAAWAGTAGQPAEEQLAGLAFADLYSGSGAVALEAASRGARPVVGIEKDRSAVDVARRNAVATGLPIQLRLAAVEKAVAQPPDHGFDVVWLDPPYALPNESVTAVLRQLVANRWVAPGGVVVVERSVRGTGFTWPDSLIDPAHRRYGETVLYFATMEGA